MKYITSAIAVSLEKNNIISSEDRDIYCYGLEILIYNSLVLALMMILGASLNVFIESIIYILIYCGLKSFTGGYHAKSYLGCFAVSLGTYLTVIASYIFIPQQIQLYLGLFLTIFSSAFIYRSCPVVNTNKIKTENEIQKYKRISNAIVFFLLILNVAIFHIGQSSLVYLIGISLFAVAIKIKISA